VLGPNLWTSNSKSPHRLNPAKIHSNPSLLEPNVKDSPDGVNVVHPNNHNALQEPLASQVKPDKTDNPVNRVEMVNPDKMANHPSVLLMTELASAAHKDLPDRLVVQDSLEIPELLEIQDNPGKVADKGLPVQLDLRVMQVNLEMLDNLATQDSLEHPVLVELVAQDKKDPLAIPDNPADPEDMVNTEARDKPETPVQPELPVNPVVLDNPAAMDNTVTMDPPVVMALIVLAHLARPLCSKPRNLLPKNISFSKLIITYVCTLLKFFISFI